MTTTSTMCGLGSDEKSTSRVLKPPGGGSSDIFGTGPVTSPNPTPQRSQHRGSSDIFGTSEVMASPQGQSGRNTGSNIFGAAHDYKLYGKGRNQSQFNPITGEAYDDTSSPAAATPEPPKPQPQVVETASPSLNASVGASAEAGQGDSALQAAPGKAQREVHTSSRVLNPPGGHTHKLW